MNKKFIQYLIAVLLLCWLTFPALAHKATNIHQQEHIFAHKMITKYHFKRSYMARLLARIKFIPEVIQRIEQPYEEKPWYIYRKNFLSNTRARYGAIFWLHHAKDLKRAEKIYGVPPEIIVAIIGVESFYGQGEGNYPVLGSLATLAFKYPPRADFFQSELAQYLILTKSQHLNPYKILGSYAGAMGYPQFMPSSYRYYAVDFSGTHKKDYDKGNDIKFQFNTLLTNFNFVFMLSFLIQIININDETLSDYICRLIVYGTL